MVKIVDFKQSHPTNYMKGRALPIKYIVIHYVGATGSAVANLKYFQGANREASAHYFVDHGPTAGVYQSVLDTDTAWHCGSKVGYKHKECRNSNSIGIELCCHKDKDGKWYFDDATIDSAVELVKELMKKYDISVDRVIRHYDVTGKKCPAMWVEDVEGWENFKSRLVEKEEVNIYKTLEDVPSWYRQSIEKLVAKGIIVGSGNGELNLTEDLCRMITIIDRLGLIP